MAPRKPAKRKIPMPVGTPSVPVEDIRRAVQKVKADREARERAERGLAKSQKQRRAGGAGAKPKRTILMPAGTPSFSPEEAMRAIDQVLAAEREQKLRSRKSR